VPRRHSRAAGAVSAAALVALCLSVFIVGTATTSAAHSALQSADPLPGSRVDRPPTQVRLRLMKASQPDARTRVRVVGPSGVDLAEGPPTVTGLGVSQRLSPAHVIGVYAVSYVIVSVDGHVNRGGYDFLLTTAAPDEPSHLPGGPLAVVGGVSLVLVVGAVGVLRARQRRGGHGRA